MIPPNITSHPIPRKSASENPEALFFAQQRATHTKPLIFPSASTAL